MLKSVIAAMGCAVLTIGLVQAQEPPAPAPIPAEPPAPAVPSTPLEPTPVPLEAPAPIAPVAPLEPVAPATPMPIDPSAVTAPTDPTAPAIPVPGETMQISPNVPRVFEFNGEELGQVLRVLARQASINMVVSENVIGTVTLRLTDVTALKAIDIIAKSKGLFVDVIDGVYYVKTPAERAAEPTEPRSYTFSYAKASSVAPLLASQLQAQGAPPQVDPRTNTIFYREVVSNLKAIQEFLDTVDQPTKQVMIEARLVETLANPQQAYGINWAGTVGSFTAPKTVRYGGLRQQDGFQSPPGPTGATFDGATGGWGLGDFMRQANTVGELTNAAFGQFAILTVPQMSATYRFLMEDSDAEFIANPRIVTADNLEATIKVVRNQPVPQLNFNEQTATAVFGGFEDKEFGNTLTVKPSINKDNFINLAVRPEISNKVTDAIFEFAGATVTSPIIDTRAMESSVLIRSGFTLAIGGLLQDESTKRANKVPIAGDIPILGYLFQEKLNSRTKRNLLVFITPTILDPEYGTGLEDQISGLDYSGEEYADPNGWRNNSKGSFRLLPTPHRSNAADMPMPGVPPTPTKPALFKKTAVYRE